MSTSNDDRPAADNMEQLKQQSACCGSGCDCHSGGSQGKMRWIICGIVLIAAAVLVVKAMNKPDQASGQPPAAAFAAPVTQPAATPVAAPAEAPAPAPVEPVATGGSAPSTITGTDDKQAVTSAGTIIGSFSELNAAATNTDAVFVYLPGKEASSNTPPTATMQAAMRTIEAKGVKCGLFTLKAGSPDYDQLAKQVTLPGVMAMVKGKGASAVSGEITETKLVQGYVAASTASACGAGGCGPKGCN